MPPALPTLPGLSQATVTSCLSSPWSASSLPAPQVQVPGTHYLGPSVQTSRPKHTHRPASSGSSNLNIRRCRPFPAGLILWV